MNCQAEGRSLARTETKRGGVRRKKKNAEKRNIVERISVFRGERSCSENLEEDATNKIEDQRSGAKIKQRERLLKKSFIC